LPGKLFLKDQSEETVELIYNNYDKKEIEQVPYADWNPSKEKSLDIRNGWVKPIGIIVFDPPGVPGGPFD